MLRVQVGLRVWRVDNGKIAVSASQNVLLAINSSLTISSITVPQSQGGVQEFTVGSIAGCAADGITTNPTGSICTVSLGFQPGYPGMRQMPLVVQTSAGSFQFALEGIGQGPQPVLQPGVITTVAGNGTAGYSGDNISATSAQLNNPSSLAVDAAGNLYIADYGNSRIRMVSAATGIIITVAGNGTFGYNGDNIAATSADLGGPAGLRLDAAGNLYIADQFNNRIRKVTVASGIITTVAGNGYGGGSGNCGGGYNGDNIAAISAELYCPADVALDATGNLYIADQLNRRIRMVNAATGIITTVAGNGRLGFSGDGGPATSAQLLPDAVAIDGAGNLYIADSYNQRIRTVSVSSAPLIFPPTEINSNSGTQTFTLANIGNAPLNLAGITPSTNFATDRSTTTCSTSSPLAAGDSCEIGVVFSPNTPGNLNGTLTLTDNALNLPGSTQQVTLSGVRAQTTTVIFQPINPVNPAYGQTVSISVNVAAQSGVGTTSTGSITFTVDSNPQPAIPLGTNGAVGLQLSGLRQARTK